MGEQPVRAVCPQPGDYPGRSEAEISEYGADEAGMHLCGRCQRDGVSGVGSVKLYDRPGDQRHRRAADGLMTKKPAGKRPGFFTSERFTARRCIVRKKPKMLKGCANVPSRYNTERTFNENVQY